jgi:hypothetical protein
MAIGGLPMPVALRKEVGAVHIPNPSVFMHLLAFGSAGLFVSLLAASYGVDLSAGFF